MSPFSSRIGEIQTQQDNFGAMVNGVAETQTIVVAANERLMWFGSVLSAPVAVNIDMTVTLRTGGGLRLEYTARFDNFDQNLLWMHPPFGTYMSGGAGGDLTIDVTADGAAGLTGCTVVTYFDLRVADVYSS